MLLNRRINRKKRELEKLNAELNHVNSNLENIIKARTSQMEGALRKAEDGEKLKMAFLVNMSHEIRTPLNGLLGFAHLLDNDKLPNHIRRQYIETMRQRGNTLTRTVNDIISISQLEVGQLTIKESACNINSLLSNLFTLFSSEVAKRKKDKIRLSLVKTLSDAKANIYTDSIRVEQILFNLIDNAFNSTNEGTIEFGYQLDTNEVIKFYVRDTGIGIEPEQQKNIFKRFLTLERPYIKSTEGSGLGLSICKGLVNLLGGNIWFKTEMGVGTTFFFTIPYKMLSPEGNEIQTNEKNRPGDYDFTNKLILVVEDDLISFQLIEALLSRTNAKLIHVKNGEDAVEVCKINSEIDLVIMDMRLPFITGYEATEQILLHNPEIKIIAQTANVFNDDKNKCFKVGCIDYIAKPIDPDEFLKIISKYLVGVVNTSNP